MAFRITVDGEDHEVEIVARRPELVLRIGDRLRTVKTVLDGTITLDGATFPFASASMGDRCFIRLRGRTIETVLVDPRSALEAAGSGHDEIRAPMPGAVVSVHKQPGDSVKRGETIITIESMKLQTALASPRDGVVAAVLKGEGETFDKDEVVARLEEIVEG